MKLGVASVKTARNTQKNTNVAPIREDLPIPQKNVMVISGFME